MASLEEMLSLLNTLYEPGKTLIVAWGNADREVLKLVCQRYGISYPYVWEDYVDLAAEYKSFYNRPRNIGLKKALEERGLKPIGIPHSALDDTYNTAQILVSMLRQGWTPQSNSLPLVQEM
ncbi:exonuclease domain-containing protein [Desulfolucanica intricata]|uniref:exonuclease domain-containing protein n=1 Tax=Desulfolucanica intricata TaxID=1285191 RepID=UPI000A409B74|nr:exonuclease domain-containing protein [Desulfolucanica intricata]